MPVAQRIRDVLAGRASAGFVGREEELRLLAECAESDGPLIAWVHGLAGVGKTALLQEFSASAMARGRQVIRLDCRFIEPTPEGFLSVLERVLDCPLPTVEAAAECLGGRKSTLLVLDGYEVLRLLDAWMCQAFVPALTETTRVVIAGRYPPGPNWRSALEWQGLIRTIPVPALNEAESAKLLERAGVPAGEASAIFRIAGGHPMALVLAGGARGNLGSKRDGMDARGTDPRGPDPRGMDPRSMVAQLTRIYLAEVTDERLRIAVEAASVVRTTTHSLLAAMVPEIYSRELYEEMAGLSIVEATSEGLMLHEQVQEAVASWLCSCDPHRRGTYRRAAWTQIRAESGQSDRRNLWRYTADMLYLLENPGLREAYYPSGAQSLALVRARPEDEEAILAIVHDHETPRSAAALRRWWQKLPQSFSVVRDLTGEVIGFYVAMDWKSLRRSMPDGDPALALLQRHLRDCPLAENETALVFRRWLSKSVGEAPSAVQAACWLDVKRSHMALRPQIRRCYGVMNDIGTYAPMLQPLGFRVVENASVEIDGVPCHLAMLDFGPGSFDGWLSDLVAGELGLRPEEILDSETRELVNPEARVALTALEFGMLRYLRQREGKTVSRVELLEQVWEQRTNSGSNVVDAVVRSLRRKLGARAWMVSTVRGVGYRFRSNPGGERRP